MRSLKIERKLRNNPRAKTVRHAARSPREASKLQPGSSRRGSSPSLFARLGNLVGRPVLAVAGLLLVLLLLAVLAILGMRAFHRAEGAVSSAAADAGFGVYEIHITGNRRVPTSTIFAALGLKPGQSIFSVDLPAARARIMALDWIASTDVVRRYPDAVTVNVVEKRPFGLWQTPPDKDGQSHLAIVERSGGVITFQDVENFSQLPKLIGQGAPETAGEVVDAVLAHRAVSARVAAYERVSGRRWNLILNDGVVVKLPEADWQKELDALEHLIVDNGILERDVTEIDLRSPAQYFFVLKNGEKKDLQRGKEKET